MQPKVMIVDDEPTNIKVLSEALKLDYELIVARDAHTAMDLLAGREIPHVILLDIMMPKIDGFTLCRTIKQRPALRHIPVIFVTALTDSESEEKGFAAGAVDYIYKPIRLPSVRARVRTHTSIRGMLDHMTKLNQRLNTCMQELTELNQRSKQEHEQIGAIEEYHNLIESIFKATSEGIAIMDGNGIILDINNSFTRISGFEKTEVVGKNFRWIEGVLTLSVGRPVIRSVTI